ncbi:MAG: YggT family protein [Ktedonobacteraceae bacterium]|nr:YggT family protein [Ktedonobacteraceae bacterium]
MLALLYAIWYLIITILVQWVIPILILAMFVRAIASWFGLDERVAFIRFLARLTDPFIKPFRRFLQPVWIFDVAFFAAFFSLIILRTLLAQALSLGFPQ